MVRDGMTIGNDHLIIIDIEVMRIYEVVIVLFYLGALKIILFFGLYPKNWCCKSVEQPDGYNKYWGVFLCISFQL